MKFSSILIAAGFLASLAIPAFPAPSVADPSLNALNTQLNDAICAQDWSSALNTVDRLMEMQTSDSYQSYMESTRVQLLGFQQTGSYFPDGMDCGRITAQDWEKALISLGASPDILTSSPAQPAVATVREAPIAGYVCSDFSTQQEAQFHYEHGTAPPELDREGDGTACEELPTDRRRGTVLLNNIATSGYSYQLLGIENREWFLRVRGDGEDFTTRSFASSDEALDYADCYYGGACHFSQAF